MKYPESKLREIYFQQMTDVAVRLNAGESLLLKYQKTGDETEFDSCVLQMRKALESMAYAAIAPNKPKYEAFRKLASSNNDFTKDFNATKIFQHLMKINSDFYPVPLIPAKKTGSNQWHFGRKADGFLTQKRFQRFYDRLGKFLHADNPWDTKKHRQNLIKDIETVIAQVRSLLELHAAFIRSKDYSGVWVVELKLGSTQPKIISATTTGEFVVGS